MQVICTQQYKWRNEIWVRPWEISSLKHLKEHSSTPHETGALTSWVLKLEQNLRVGVPAASQAHCDVPYLRAATSDPTQPCLHAAGAAVLPMVGQRALHSHKLNNPLQHDHSAQHLLWMNYMVSARLCWWLNSKHNQWKGSAGAL